MTTTDTHAAFLADDRARARFERTLDRDSAGACFGWRGKIDQRGNPIFKYQGRELSARRLALLLAGVELPEGERAIQTCEASGCTNPAHVRVSFPGSEQQEDCARGHALSPENVYLTTQGKRACRSCLTAGVQRRGPAHNLRRRTLRAQAAA